MLRVISYKGYDPQTGQFVFLRLLDVAGRELARTVDTSSPDIALLLRHVGTASAITSQSPALEVSRVRFENSRFLRVQQRLSDSRGMTAFNLEGFFATSSEESQAEAKNLAKTNLLSAGAVLAASLLLYPVILRLLRRLAGLSHSLLDSNLQTLQVLGSAIAKRDSDTDLHNFRVTIYSVLIAEALGLDNRTMRPLIKGAFLHDIGKIGIRDNILLKPGKLDTVEFEEMKRHVDYAVDIVSRSQWIGESLPVVACHHEKFQGKGYSKGIAGEAIPLLARIFAIADVFDALTSRRPYKEPMGFEDSVAIIIEGRGNHFDPTVLDVFLTIARPLFDQ